MPLVVPYSGDDGVSHCILSVCAQVPVVMSGYCRAAAPRLPIAAKPNLGAASPRKGNRLAQQTYARHRWAAGILG